MGLSTCRPASARPRPRVRVLVVGAAVLALAGSCTGSPSPGRATPSGSSSSPAAASAGAPAALRSFYTQKLTWTDCGGGFSCTKVTVPIDYAHPSAGRLSLAVNRLPATDRAHRIGSLLVNPGGPGASGLNYARSSDTVASPAVLARFDLVGFDPRGVGQSDPVHCVSNAVKDKLLSGDATPQGAAQIASWQRQDKIFAQGCERHSGTLLPHMSTVDAARDLDVLRAVLGDAHLYYLGKSYGTFLGATYAGLFPARVGRLVLDGAVDPTLTGTAEDLAQAKGFETALRSFIGYCTGRKGCPLPQNADAAVRRVQSFLASLRHHPIAGIGGRKLDQAQGLTGIAAALYDSGHGWPALLIALNQAAGGDGAALLSLADSYNQRGLDGRYLSNELAANSAVNCLDRAERPSIAQIKRNAVRFAAAAPTFGRFLAWSSLGCDAWPVKATGHPHAITARGAAPILVVGTTRDPATPFAWAQHLAAQLSSGRLLRWNGDGHTAYRRGSDCADSHVDAYLLQKKAPKSATCAS